MGVTSGRVRAAAASTDRSASTEEEDELEPTTLPVGVTADMEERERPTASLAGVIALERRCVSERSAHIHHSVSDSGCHMVPEAAAQSGAEKVGGEDVQRLWMWGP